MSNREFSLMRHWSDDELNRLWSLFSRGLSGEEIAQKLSRSPNDVQEKLCDSGMARIQSWYVRFAGREILGMWDDSWQAERHAGSGGHVHFHPSRNRTFKNKVDAVGSALRKARLWAEDDTSTTFKPIQKI